MTKVEQIAESVRHWCVCHSIGFGFQTDMCGMCAIASYRMYKQLRKAGFRAHIYIAKHYGLRAHAYIMVGKYIIDCTATQFDKAPIIIKKKSPHDDWYWRKGKKVLFNQFYDKLGMGEWEDQSPFYKTKERGINENY